MFSHIKQVIFLLLCVPLSFILFNASTATAANTGLNLEDLPETSLDLLLIGTAPEKGNKGFAIILDNETKVQKICRVGDYIKKAQVRNVYRDQVVISHDGALELLTFTDPRRVESVPAEQAIDEEVIPPEVPDIVGYDPEVFVMRAEGETGPDGKKPPLRKIIIRSKQKLAQ